MPKILQPKALVNRVRYFLNHRETGTLKIPEPIGWKDDDLEIVRNKNLHGVKVVISNNLQFTEAGRNFINQVRDVYGINAKLYLVKDEKDAKSDKWTRSYSGLLDLATWGV